NVDMLYDVVTLSYHYDFAGQTLKLGADITVNEGNAADWETKAPKWSWAPIRDFAGTFDGQGHTISGIYAKTLNETTALFTHVKSSAVIRDFRLENTLFLTSGAVGSASVAADCAGTYQRIYSNAVVRCNYGAVGGLFSRQSGKLTAEECWFDGVVETSHRNIGGIADQADGAEMVLSHCLNTGKIIDTWHIGANNAGGLVGMTVNSARLVIDDCFTSGALELGSQFRSGSVLGGGDATGNATIMNTFCVLETCDYPVSELITNKVGGPIAIMEKNLRGIKAYQWTNLDFENYWACEDGSFPVLKCFAKQPLDTAGVVREADYDWYDETAQELVITNLPQLYAFTLLSGNTDYASQTVKLAVDLALNDGLAENWIETAPENRWYPVQWFAGTFDGQGHTLSGIYVKGPNAQGLFGRAKGTAVLKNFRLENSLIHATADSPTNPNFAGSGTVVGRGGGTLDTIYSNAIVYAEGMQIGGIIGQVNLRGMITTINNCWFDGKAITKGEEYGYQVGGIVGGQALGTVNMTHCLNTGFLHTEVNKGSVAGGFVGTVMNDSVMNIGDCLNAGILDTANPYYVGGGVGMSYTGPIITVNNSYAMRECMGNYLGEYASHNGNSDKVKFTGGTIPVLQRYLTGTGAYEWTNLNFDKYWSVRPDGCPVLTSFYDGEKVSTDGLEKAFSFDWFDAEAGGGTIYTRADFIGFTMLSWTTKFEEQTVRLGADITLNTGDASSWGGSDPYWQLIPMSTFGGTFDGQGHTVSGVFARQEASVGLFGRTAKTAVIQNLRLVNSFYDVLGFGENHFGIAGSIVGQGGGTLRNIYSNATLRTKGVATAGIIGRL
ncbi:MAG: hypothetical protein IJU18_06365, partial [Oscillospiraceae bacterium]|nr:hypothetical protein [Oscillospiraceae bacterium]